MMKALFIIRIYSCDKKVVHFITKKKKTTENNDKVCQSLPKGCWWLIKSKHYVLLSDVISLEDLFYLPCLRFKMSRMNSDSVLERLISRMKLIFTIYEIKETKCVHQNVAFFLHSEPRCLISSTNQTQNHMVK